jgi:tetratricopeptide (TPR) repeat protein
VRRHLNVVLLLAALTLAGYGNALRFERAFALDNRAIILDDPRLRAVTGPNVRAIFTQDYWREPLGGVTRLYRPFTTLSYLFNYAVLGNAGRSAGYIAVNMLLHCGNAMLLYALMAGLAGNPWPAGAAAALFAVHPIATEAVTNIVGRADLLATMSVLAGALLYARSLDATGRRWPWLTGLAVIALAGMLCKENAIVLPAALVLYALVARRRWFDIGWFAVAPGLVAWLAIRQALYRGAVVLESSASDNPLIAMDFWPARLTAVQVIGRYLWRLVWPAALSCDYSFNQIVSAIGPALAALAVVIAAFAVAVRLRRRQPSVSFCAIFFFAALLPVSNLVVPVGSIMAERFVYMALAGFAGIVGIALTRLRIRNLVVGLIVVAFTARTYARNFDWRDDASLWSAAVRVCPASYKAQWTYGKVLAAEDNLDEAIAHIERAVAIAPHERGPWLDLGRCYRLRGELEKSFDALRRADELDRAFAQRARERRWAASQQTNAFAEADNYLVGYELGLTCLRHGAAGEARAAFTRSLALAPVYSEAYVGLAGAFEAEGDGAVAAELYVAAMLIDPARADVWPRLVNLYEQVDGGACALVHLDGRYRLNPECPLVRQQVCRAYGVIAGFCEAAKQPATASEARERAWRIYGCGGE